MKMPGEIAAAIGEVGVKKTQLPIAKMIVLGILAGVYIGFGALIMTTVRVGLADKLGAGFASFLGGACFSVGLMLVVIGGSELFTGNCMMTNALCSRKITFAAMLKNWVFVYIGNFIGSILLVTIVFIGFYCFREPGGVGALAVKIADIKVNLTFWEALFRGIGCNWLVCLAVWLAASSDDTVGKVFGIFFPIMAFVAIGFEHSIANMYFIPMGIFLKNFACLAASSHLTWGGFLGHNLIPVTLGNIIGGSIFVGIFYWYSYIDKR